MAVFTAAALAIGAAIATTTAATVATAVVATSIAVGVAGLAVTAVGMITKNQDLLKAGKIMGYVGLAGGLAGGAIGGFGAMASGGEFLAGAADAFAGASQFIQQGWESGVGSLFSGGEQVAGALPGVTGTTGTTGTTGAATEPFVPTQANAGINAAAPSTSLDVSAQLPGSTIGGGQSVASQPVISASPSIPVSAQVQAPLDPFAQQVAANISQAGQIGQGSVLAPSTVLSTPSSSAATGLANMPEWAKYAAMTSAGQGVSGLASGYFTGASAEENLEQQKLINQQQQNQLQLLNRQGSYAPMIQFRRPVGT